MVFAKEVSESVTRTIPFLLEIKVKKKYRTFETYLGVEK